MRYLFLAYLILNPLFYIMGKDLRVVQEFFFQISSMVLILASLFFESKPIKRSRVNLGIGALGLWFVCVFLLNNMGWTIMLNMFLGTMVYFTTVRTLKEEDIRFLFYGIIGISVLAVIHLAGQYLNWDLRGQVMIGKSQGVPHCSFFALKAAMGMYLALAAGVVLSFSWVGLLLFFPIVLSYSSGACLAVGVGTLFYLWFRRRLAFWIVLIPMLLGGIGFLVFMDGPTGMLTTRIPMWKMVIEDAHRRPLGAGLDSFRNPKEGKYLRYYKIPFCDKSVRVIRVGEQHNIVTPITDEELGRMKHEQERGISTLDFWDHPHNEYIWLMYELGFPALFMLLFILYGLGSAFYISARSNNTTALFSCLLMILLMSLTQFPFHMARIAHTIPVLLGLFMISVEDKYVN